MKLIFFLTTFLIGLNATADKGVQSTDQSERPSRQTARKKAADLLRPYTGQKPKNPVVTFEPLTSISAKEFIARRTGTWRSLLHCDGFPIAEHDVKRKFDTETIYGKNEQGDLTYQEFLLRPEGKTPTKSTTIPVHYEVLAQGSGQFSVTYFFEGDPRLHPESLIQIKETGEIAISTRSSATSAVCPNGRNADLLEVREEEDFAGS